MNKKGQITIFIIVAVIIVASVGLYFSLKGSLIPDKVPATFEPIYTQFLSCLEENSLVGIDLLGTHAGYIELPEFEPGSSYMPFSSQLDFLGTAVPYWYYVSGNNIQKEQVPSKTQMGRQLANFIESQIDDCVLDNYYEQGFSFERGNPSVRASIRDDRVEVNLNMNIVISKGAETFILTNHKLSIRSNLGKLYDSAIKIYNQEQDELFLEKYAFDTLNLYAPVDGIEISCAPKIWDANEIFDDLEDAIQANTGALKIKGGDYVLKNEENEYFVLDIPVNEDVRFINSKNWPRGFEVEPSEGSLLMADPIGNQPELGILGFCYAPYHFVYNIRYTVLIQVYEDDEIFQFPMAVVLQGNNPREALIGSALGNVEDSGFCDARNTPVSVNVYDSSLNAIEAEIFYECFGDKCSIGTSPLQEDFPQCVNGYVIAKAEGYEISRQLFSTTEGGSVSIVLDKIYEKRVNLILEGVPYGGDAMISFSSEDGGSRTVVYPGQRNVELSEGSYDVQVYIFKNSSLNIESTTVEQCIKVTSSGLGGLLGLTEEKCFDLEIPSEIISNALAGGGKQTIFFLESELKNFGVVEIRTSSLPPPNSLNQLQSNYILFENRGLDIFLI